MQRLCGRVSHAAQVTTSLLFALVTGLPGSTTGTESPVGLDVGTLVRRSIITFVCMVGLGAAFTALFFSMRSVMDIGGRCYSGNVGIDPSVVQQCPTGVAGLMIGAIFGGLIFLGIYAFNAVGPNLDAPRVAGTVPEPGLELPRYASRRPTGATASSGAGWSAGSCSC